MKWVLGGLIYVGLHLTGGWLLERQPVARAVFGSTAMLLPALALVGVVVRRRHQWFGCQRLFWVSVAVGAGLWAVGHAGWSADALTFGRAHPWLAWHTLVSLAGGGALVAAVIAAPHRGPRESAAPTLAMDIAALGILLLFLLSVLVLAPSLVPALQDQAQRALVVAGQVLRGVLLVSLAWLALRAETSEWRSVYARLAGAVALGGLIRAATGLWAARDAATLGTAADLTWIVPYLGVTWVAATAPASSEAARSEPDITLRLPHLTFASLTVVLVVGYVTHVALPLGAPADGFRDILTVVSVLALGAVLAARFSVQRAQLREAGSRVRLLAAATQQTGDMILIVRKDGAIDEVNEACCRMLGYAREELVGRTMESLLGPGAHQLLEAMRAGLRKDRTWRGTFERYRKDGSAFPVACSVVGLVDRFGRLTHYVGVERDITEDLRVRDRLIQTERLSAIGELAAGVAHEINNPLQTILGRAELMLGDSDLTAARRDDVEAVRHEATRVALIVRNLLSFVRRSSAERTMVDVCEVVRSLISLRAYPARQENLVIDVHVPDEPLIVEATRDGLQQILTNLLLNAEHAAKAFPGQGTITVRAWGNAGGAHVEVADDGPGISPEIRERIFEPFFTTRPTGEGTGLGLSTARGIAGALGGRLELVPSPRGACFRLSFPTPES
jgi:PAS domain S-box-containing protein